MTALSMVWGAMGVQAQTVSLISDDEETILQTLVVQAASDELKQALGVSTITAEDLANKPSGRDVSEIIRTMPGVNLTGNTATGQRGNNRQIDIRGMGPENTLILIDGKPVLSRNSVRMGRQGERDTRGDTAWVPPEMIERIEVIRGPAAARYGSGASGGVVNIITKRPETTTVTVSSYLQVPEHVEEGGTKRANIAIGGPINDVFSYRLMAGGSWTDPDSTNINDEATEDTDSPAGREGVVSYDLRGLWSAQIDADNKIDVEATYSRQSNIYAGDTLLRGGTSAGSLAEGLADIGAETNRVERTTLSATHYGTYAFGDSESYVQWEHTFNHRLKEGTAGGGEGEINATDEYNDITLDNLIAKSEWDLPVDMIWNQTVTLGAEYRGEFMSDPTVQDQSPFTDASPGLGVTLDPAERDPDIEAHLAAIYAEDNILVTDQLTVTPGIRLDWHDRFGINFSPSLNASFKLTDEITLKGGIARAFKAPNLFQLNPNYYWNSRGNGCPPGMGPCAVIGNPDLDPEISINKELGIAYANLDGWAASLSYFHNDYDNRIVAGTTSYGQINGGTNVFRWENSGPAVVSGIEGNLTVPVHESLTWTTNFTKMIESKDLTTGQPLSLVPEYTINTALRWEALEDLGLTLSATHYGKISPRTVDARGEPITDVAELETRDPYTIFNFGLDYKPTEQLKISAGINNLFDERLFRTGNGANTYNEPGRTYYLSLAGTF